jgi:hypothetical protein
LLAAVQLKEEWMELTGVCISGEAAADPPLAITLAGVRAELARFALDDARRFAGLTPAANSAGEALAAVPVADTSQRHPASSTETGAQS